MLHADLYEESVPLESYVSGEDCSACGFRDRDEFLERLRSGEIRPGQCSMATARLRTLLWAARPREILPAVEVLQLPDPAPPGLFPVNEPGRRSPLLVSGNSRLTIEVLTTVLSTTLSPFWYLAVDTDGHTVDMALVYEAFTIDRILHSLTRERIDEQAPDATVYLPGLAAPLRDDLAAKSGRPVSPGPVCAAELPLFFGEALWRLAE
jgi:hypothetical protein